MTILCAAALGLTGVRPCSEPGEHRVTCPDHPGFRNPPGRCGGCLPRAADRGYLCTHHYDRVENAYMRWAPFVRLLAETEGRAVSPETGGGGSATGHSNLPLTFLAVDECERHLASRENRTIDAWVHTDTGARDAVLFATAAENAYRTLEVEEREQVIVREKCPHCGAITVRGHLTRERAGTPIVECEWCHQPLAKIRTAPAAHTDSEACEHHDHAACEELACRCACHEIGHRSRPQGVRALWDADLATVTGWRDRAVWGWDGQSIHPQRDERKTA